MKNKDYDDFDELLPGNFSKISIADKFSISGVSPYIEAVPNRIFDYDLHKGDDRVEYFEQPKSKFGINYDANLNAFIKADARVLWEDVALVNKDFPLLHRDGEIQIS